MANIYDGSYVLGDVSATQIVAGEGIKIDNSQPGVIKVSNDETVLYSGAGTSAVTGNETFNNFQYIDLWINHANYGPSREVRLDMNAFTTNTGYFGLERPRGTTNLNVAFLRFEVNKSDGSISCTHSKCIEFGSYNSTATTYTVSLNASEDRNSIVKICGINRKQNGGN